MTKIKLNLRPAAVQDRADILKLAENMGFEPGPEMEELNNLLSAYFSAELGADHYWLVDDEDGIRSALYYAPEMMTDGVWNLYFISVRSDLQGQGYGGVLLQAVEDDLKDKNQRMLLIETSGLETFKATRAFYHKHQYEQEACIRDYYAYGDDKIIFRKVL